MPDQLGEFVDAGYLPVAVDFDAGTLTLAPLAAADFHETWYDNTVAASSGAPLVTVGLATLLTGLGDTFSSGAEHSCPPLRVIAHVSRCGSTLLANLLTLRPTTMVLKEPDFVTDVAQAVALATNGTERRLHHGLLRVLLDHVAHVAAARGRIPVVKVTSWTAPIIMACLADDTRTTWLLQWRRPHDVVLSNRVDPPSWGRPSERGRAARRAASLDADGSDMIELVASVWSHVVGSFTGAPAGLCYRTLSYDALRADRARALLEVEAWFGIASAGLPPGFGVESCRYSKGRSTERFNPTGAHHREDLDGATARRVDRFTGAAERLLERSDRRLF